MDIFSVAKIGIRFAHFMPIFSTPKMQMMLALSFHTLKMTHQLINLLSLCIALASAETVHGVFRAAILVPKIGKKAALKVAIITGSIVAFLVCLYFVPKFGTSDILILSGLGIFISTFMAAFDITLSMLLLKKSFRKSLNDFNPKSGNYLIFGLIFLTTYPNIVMFVKTHTL